MSCKVFLSSLDRVTCLYRTPFHSTKWLCCHRYCFRVCMSCKYTLHPFSLFLLIRYLIPLSQGLDSGLWSSLSVTWLMGLSAYLRPQWPPYCMNTPLSRGYTVSHLKRVYRLCQLQYGHHDPPMEHRKNHWHLHSHFLTYNWGWNFN